MKTRAGLTRKKEKNEWWSSSAGLVWPVRNVRGPSRRMSDKGLLTNRLIQEGSEENNKQLFKMLIKQFYEDFQSESGVNRPAEWFWSLWEDSLSAGPFHKSLHPGALWASLCFLENRFLPKTSSQSICQTWKHCTDNAQNNCKCTSQFYVLIWPTDLACWLPTLKQTKCQAGRTSGRTHRNRSGQEL